MWQRCLILSRSRSLAHRTQCRTYSDRTAFSIGDYVILKTGRGRAARELFRGPLTPEKIIETHNGNISHAEIIGKRPLDILESKTKLGKEDTKYRLHQARLDEYVLYTKRLVTPIYPNDASLIVNLFDIHAQPRPNPAADEQSSPEIEILEAGTGHGALTLYLSRAIHAANGAVPASPQKVNDSGESEIEQSNEWSEWKRSRNALIHSIEKLPRVSNHAAKIVKGFNRGQYQHNVNFHVGDVKEWTEDALRQRSNEPFLTHAFLDLPDTEHYLATVASAMKTDGSLIIFNPSISQVMECLRKVKAERIPFALDKVIELGVNGGSGGREWDVRAVLPRATAKKLEEDADISSTDSDGASESEASQSHENGMASESDWRMICRPKVGERIYGGGFLALFKRKRDAVQE